MTDNSGTVFPMPGFNTALTKRELAAFMAMQGILSNPILMAAFSQATQEVDKATKGVSEFSLKQADALLSELNKKEEK